ncbi:MAG: phosphate/phosphite/phosphonate ABC transporter substrate-binding protein [Chloroflexi bacterium]|nr:phosphate/phosphite/phosphonate ABC transporter substrate-binding protein [Chloroflexota bacterium]
MLANKQTCKKRIVLLTLTLLFTLGCTFPLQVMFGTPTAVSTPTAAPIPTQPPLSTPAPGTDQNPLILALAATPRPSDAILSAGDILAAYLEQRTGYRIVTVVPSSEQALVEALAVGNAHIAALSPYAFVMARNESSVTALLARLHNGEMFYGAQILINRDSEFTSYFDEARGENTVDAATAFKQFADKKPCWSDKVSPSGYVVPLGLLNQAQVTTRAGAFLEGQPNVVRGVYADDICDFGATFIDARTTPILEADYPDVMDKVLVAWRVPEIIPYENISMASSLPIEMRRVIQRAFIDFMTTPEGKAAMQTIYGFDAMLPVEDSAYAEFIALVNASQLDLLTLIE